jgi:hypothetical protein
MGTSRNVAQLRAKTELTAKVITGGNRDATAAAADVYKANVLRTGRRDSGGDLRLSRWGRRGLKLNAGYDLDGTIVATATLRPRPMGPWKVLEYGARPHVIVAGLTRRQGQALALFSFMAGGAGSFDLGELAGIAQGNRNNRRTTRSQARARALTIGENRRPFANHPGVDGKNTFSDGIARGTKGAVSASRKEHAKNIAEVWR